MCFYVHLQRKQTYSVSLSGTLQLLPRAVELFAKLPSGLMMSSAGSWLLFPKTQTFHTVFASLVFVFFYKPPATKQLRQCCSILQFYNVTNALEHWLSLTQHIFNKHSSRRETRTKHKRYKHWLQIGMCVIKLYLPHKPQRSPENISGNDTSTKWFPSNFTHSPKSVSNIT